MIVIRVLFTLIRNILADRAELVTENLALRHDEERTSPVRPETGQPSPEDAVALAQSRALGLVLDRELLARRDDIFRNHTWAMAKIRSCRLT